MKSTMIAEAWRSFIKTMPYFDEFDPATKVKLKCIFFSGALVAMGATRRVSAEALVDPLKAIKKMNALQAEIEDGCLALSDQIDQHQKGQTIKLETTANPATN